MAAEADRVAIRDTAARRRPSGSAGDAAFYGLTVFFATLVLVILAFVLLLFGLAGRLERRLLRWRG